MRPVASKYGVGASLLRREDERHLRGRGEFVGDIRLPGTQQVVFLRSPHAHARIRGITVPGAARGRVFTAADLPRMQALQRAFAASGAFQCGFCTPGMLVAAHALLAADPAPDDAAIRRALSGNLCRCTGYARIVAAVRDAAAALADRGAAS